MEFHCFPWSLAEVPALAMRDAQVYLPRAGNEIVSWLPGATQFTCKIPSTGQEQVRDSYYFGSSA